MKKPKLGQHFLVDEQVVLRQIRYAEVSSKDTVLEIGPGHGILTKLLAQHARTVVAVELDNKLVDELQRWVPSNVLLVHGDAVKVDYSSLPRFTKIVANLPYKISSPITFRLLALPFKKAVLMYQKDFAVRMTAPPRSSEYSRLSVGVYYKARCCILETVPRNCFIPQPNVESSLVELIPRAKPPFPVEDEAFFFEITKKLFTHRRKTIKTILGKTYGPLPRDFPYLSQRVEKLSPEEIGELSNLLHKQGFR